MRCKEKPSLRRDGRRRIWQRYYSRFAEIIEAADQNRASGFSGARLRDDAKAFLLGNLVSMIALPVAEGGKISEAELSEALRHDVSLLVSEAKADSENEISGHAIIDALSSNWNRLRTTALNVWE